MPKVFSPRTLAQFEDASASIVLRQIDRVFARAEIRLGEDPGGLAGDRRTQFRRYVASVNQHDSQELDRLGDALGALIEAVAASKEDYLVKAAEHDGFVYANGVFRRTATDPNSFAVTCVAELAFLDDRGRRLHLLANLSPSDAIGGANEFLESVCRTVLRALGKPAGAKTTDLVDIAKSTLDALELVAAGNNDAKTGATLVRSCLQQLSAGVTILGKLKGGSPRHARLAVGAAMTFTAFVAEAYMQRAALKSVDGVEVG